MSSVQDNSAIKSLLSRQKVKPFSTYRSRVLESQLATTSTFTTQVEFNTSNLASRPIDWSQAFLQLPLTITLPAAMNGVYPACKTSNLSFISGSALSHADGRSIYSDYKSAHFSNALRMALDNSLDWQLLCGDQNGFSMDRTIAGVRGMAIPDVVQSPSVVKASSCTGMTSNGENPNYNVGYAEKQVYMQNAMFDDKGVAIPQDASKQIVTILVNLPLALIHDFYKNLDFLVLGTEFIFTFNINSPNLTSHCPVCIGTSAALTGANYLKNVPDAGASAGGSGVQVAITAGGTPRLFYHAVELETDDAEAFTTQWRNGFEKKIEYSAYDLIQSAPFNNIATGTEVNHQLSTSCCGAVRIYAMAYPTGLVHTAVWPSTLVTTAQGFSTVNLLINNEPYYAIPINTLSQQWGLLKSAMGTSEDDDATSLISFSNFQKLNRILCFDLTRLRGKLADANLPLSYMVNGVISSTVNVDMIYLIERRMEVKLDFKYGHRTGTTSGPKRV